MLMEKTKNQMINEEIMQPKQNYKNDNEVRIAVLETSQTYINKTLERIERTLVKMDDKIDNRFFWLLGTIGAITLLIMGTMAKGFHWIGG